MIRSAIILATLVMIAACSRGGLNEELDGVAVICGLKTCGTAWTIDESGLLVTAAHVVSTWPVGEIMFASSLRYFDTDTAPTVYWGALEVVYKNTKEDIAFLRPHLPDNYAFYPYELCNELKLFDAALVVSAINDNVASRHVALGILDIASGTVTALSKHKFLAAAVSENGFSGGPLFVSRGTDYSCVGGMVVESQGLREEYSAGPRVRTIRHLYTSLTCPKCKSGGQTEKYQQK